MGDMELFDGYDSVASSAQADRLFQAWRATPDCRPRLASTRTDTITRRICEAVDAGFDTETIFGALETCYKFSSKRAWSVSLDIARRETRQRRQPVFSDTQAAILRVRENNGGLQVTQMEA